MWVLKAYIYPVNQCKVLVFQEKCLSSADYSLSLFMVFMQVLNFSNLSVPLFYFQGKGETLNEIQSPAGDKVQKHGSESDRNAVSAKKAVLRQESELSMEDNITPTGKDYFPFFLSQKHPSICKVNSCIFFFLTHFCAFANVCNGRELFAL